MRFQTDAYDLWLEVLVIQYHRSDNAQQRNFDSV